MRGRFRSARSAVPPPFAAERRSVTNFQPRPRHKGHEFFPVADIRRSYALPDPERQPRRKGLPLESQR
jgi:hypothetical protein